MGQNHEAICRKLRQDYFIQGFKSIKSPLTTYRPDIFVQRQLTPVTFEQIIVEVEIESTLFNDHTIEQLVLMHSFLSELKRKKKIQGRGVLAVPKDIRTHRRARLLLRSILSKGHNIEIVEIAV